MPIEILDYNGKPIIRIKPENPGTPYIQFGLSKARLIRDNYQSILDFLFEYDKPAEPGD